MGIRAVVIKKETENFEDICKNVGFDIVAVHDYSPIFMGGFASLSMMYGQMLKYADAIIIDQGEGASRSTSISAVIHACEAVGMPVYWQGDIYNMMVQIFTGKEVEYKYGTFNRLQYWDDIDASVSTGESDGGPSEPGGDPGMLV